MKALVMTAAAALALGAAQYSTETVDTPVIEREVVAESERPVNTYRLSVVGGGNSCLIEKGAAVNDIRFPLAVAAECADLFPGIDLVRYWEERGDGAVALVSTDGETLAAFAVSDGLDYESFRPVMPLMSLVASAD